jgi:hypothetical protein
MYKIRETNGQNSTGAWVKPVFNWTDLKSKGYARLYVMASKVVRDPTWRIDDNENLSTIRTDAENNDVSTGLYINPDGIGISYALCLIDLAGKVGVEDDKNLPSDASDGLLPCVMISSFPVGYKVNQIEGDLFNYINSVLLTRYNNIVLCLNQSTANVLANSGSKLILDTLALPSVRIWYYRPGLTAEKLDAELYATPMKKHAWLAGVAIGETLVDWQVTPPPPPDPTCPTGQHWDYILNKCVDNVSPPPSPIVDTKHEIAVHLRAIADLVEKL